MEQKLENLNDLTMQCECCKSVLNRANAYYIDLTNPEIEALKIIRYLQDKWPEYHKDLECGDVFGLYYAGDYVGFGILAINKKYSPSHFYISHLVISHNLSSESLDLDLIKYIRNFRNINNDRSNSYLYIVVPSRPEADIILNDLNGGQIVQMGKSIEFEKIGLMTLNNRESDDCYLINILA